MDPLSTCRAVHRSVSPGDTLRAGPQDVTWSPDGRRLLVTDSGDGTVGLLDAGEQPG